MQNRRQTESIGQACLRYAEVRRRKSLRSRVNAKCRMQNAKCRTDAAEREQRVLAHYAESQGGKALEEGLMQNAKLEKNYAIAR